MKKQLHLLSSIFLLFSPVLSSCTKTSHPLPNVNFLGSIEGISKDTKVYIKGEYENSENNELFDFEMTAKWQGNFSAKNFPKKNFNIELFEKNTDYKTKKKIKLQENWPEDNEYTLKANYSDVLGCHNVVGCQIWTDIIHSRKFDEHLTKLWNGGAIDGFPITLNINGEKQGLYTLNLKKSKKLYDMTSSEQKHEAMFLGHVNAEDEPKEYNSLLFKDIIRDDFESEGWDVEFCSTSDKTWIRNSFNNFISFVINTEDQQTFKNQLSNYTNVGILLDYFIYITLNTAGDNWSNNVMWVTYDGQHWIPTIYDFDYSFGFDSVGVRNYDVDFAPTTDQSLLWLKVRQSFANELQEEWQLLKEETLSYSNVMKKINNFMNKIKNAKSKPTVFELDKQIWPEAPYRVFGENTIENLDNFMKKRIQFLKFN